MTGGGAPMEHREMASGGERFHETDGKLKRAWVARYFDREGKRRHVTFQTQEAWSYFLEEIKKKEDLWKAERLLSKIGGDNGQR
ncbi:hypothetical protein ACFQWF_14845 [Methylorubrum suomiense]